MATRQLRLVGFALYPTVTLNKQLRKCSDSAHCHENYTADRDDNREGLGPTSRARSGSSGDLAS